MAVGSVTVVSREPINIGKRLVKVVERVEITWIGSSTDGTVPALSIPLQGYVLKVVTNPGTTAPTDNYDIFWYDPDDAALDAMCDGTKDRDTANGENAYPTLTGASIPVFLCGTYSMEIKGNSVNSATGKIVVYLADSL